MSTAEASSTSVNVAERLAQIAAQMPTAVAVAAPGGPDVAGNHTYTTCTFAELDRDATALARGLVDFGVTPGMRLVLLVRPGVKFVKLVFALLRSGATTVLVDPGMGRRHLVNCLSAAEPRGFVAIGAAQALRVALRRRFPLATKNVTVGRRLFWGGTTYRQLLQRGRTSQCKLPLTTADDPAAIIFTSGSTGPPKGVLTTHRMFDTQAAQIQQQYDITPGGADLACFALFGLFNSAMGVTTVFPKMDFSRPGQADPRRLLDAASDWQVTQAFASPTVWRKLGAYCAKHGAQISTLRKVFSCGAPVPAEVIRQTLACVAVGAEMHTPYGATESLPVATIEGAEILGETGKRTAQGAGVCVGRRLESIEWRVIRISEEPIRSIAEAEVLGAGEIGELAVSGPQVSPRYVVGDPRHNHDAKIADGDGVWHRLGDVGYLDAQERFWYCGRKVHRVETPAGVMFTIPCEAVFEVRSALVGVGARGRQRPVLVVEFRGSPQEWKVLENKLRRRAKEFAHTAAIEDFLPHPKFPVDVRHNAKIHREKLAAWAERKIERKTERKTGQV